MNACPARGGRFCCCGRGGSCSADLRRKFGSAVLMFAGGGLWWGLGDDRYTDKKMPDRGIGH